MTFLTRSEILERRSFRTETVEVPEWGGAVRLREMSGADRQAIQAAVLRAQKGPSASEDVHAHVVACAAVNENGEKIFSPSDVPALSRQPAGLLKRLAEKALEISGLAGDMEGTGAAEGFTIPNGASSSV